MDKIDDRKKKLLEALEECHGIITDACNKAGVARASYYNWISEDPEFKAACEEAQEAAIDYVEGQLFKRISGVSVEGADGEVFEQPPSDTAIIFYLKTKGKKRGYVERSEVDHSGGIKLSKPSWFDDAMETKTT